MSVKNEYDELKRAIRKSAESIMRDSERGDIYAKGIIHSIVEDEINLIIKKELEDMKSKIHYEKD